MGGKKWKITQNHSSLKHSRNGVSTSSQRASQRQIVCRKARQRHVLESQLHRGQPALPVRDTRWPTHPARQGDKRCWLYGQWRWTPSDQNAPRLQPELCGPDSHRHRRWLHDVGVHLNFWGSHKHFSEHKHSIPGQVISWHKK